MNGELVPRLSPLEHSRLAELEAVVGRGLQTFVDVADNLRAARGLPPCASLAAALDEFERWERTR